ncbi:hypothetical protein JW796_02020 [Candidatus Dojkabacteria bacterium]|nr:hypothetical protein [Candidatus Dojkabacteria bacterium]
MDSYTEIFGSSSHNKEVSADKYAFYRERRTDYSTALDLATHESMCMIADNLFSPFDHHIFTEIRLELMDDLKALGIDLNSFFQTSSKGEPVNLELLKRESLNPKPDAISHRIALSSLLSFESPELDPEILKRIENREISREILEYMESFYGENASGESDEENWLRVYYLAVVLLEAVTKDKKDREENYT